MKKTLSRSPRDFRKLTVGNALPIGWAVIPFAMLFLFAIPGPGLAEQGKPTVPEKIASDHLPNSFRVTDRVISGGLPEDEKAFAELRNLGVRTIISVDGAKPDVATAKKFGLRYVHLPHGYDGISDERARELAKAVRELPGSIYIHCHHGKHRSPAAAATACVTAGTLSPDDAISVLTAAGTSKNYRGLYQSVEAARPIDAKALNELQVQFRETVEVPPLAQAMVALEHTHDHLKSMAANDWKPLPKHPDLDPAHEALLLREHFTELLRTPEVQAQPREFIESLEQSEKAAKALELGLQAATLNDKRLTLALTTVTNQCQACHQTFRDRPLGRK